MHDLADHDGSGGLIAVDKKGNLSLPFNCDGMYRGTVTQEGDFQTLIYR
jgi:beta-aspartyl-peptidase (threonine type)